MYKSATTRKNGVTNWEIQKAAEGSLSEDKGGGKEISGNRPCIETLETQEKKSSKASILVVKGLDDDTLKLPVSDRLVDPGDILTNGPVIPASHTGQAVDTNVIESLKVLLAVHLDLQTYPNELVHGSGPLEVLARWGRSTRIIEERLSELSMESGQAA